MVALSLEDIFKMTKDFGRKKKDGSRFWLNKHREKDGRKVSILQQYM